MYSIIELKGHQYRVEAGTLLDVDKMDQEVGSDIEIKDVLLVSGDEPLIGKPCVDGACVTARLVKHGKDRKIPVYRRGVGKWSRFKGHRREYSCLYVTEINNGKGDVSKVDANSEQSKKYLAAAEASSPSAKTE